MIIRLSYYKLTIPYGTNLSPNMTSEMHPSKAGGGVRLRLEDSSGGTPPRNRPPLLGACTTPERGGS